MRITRFQHSAARRRLRARALLNIREGRVSTLSRAEAAAQGIFCELRIAIVSTLSRAEAAATYIRFVYVFCQGFNTQPRGGGCTLTFADNVTCIQVSTLSRAEAAATYVNDDDASIKFQHSAARRRLLS